MLTTFFEVIETSVEKVVLMACFSLWMLPAFKVDPASLRGLRWWEPSWRNWVGPGGLPSHGLI